MLADCATARARIEATQTLALAHVAAIDTVDAGTDDGSWVEQHRGLGHVRFDAPELVAPTLGLTPSAAEAKVRQAVALTTRTPAVITAMASGRGDAYRAGILAEELAEAPGPEARAVVAALIDRFGHEPGGRLRARVRRELNKINPELVRHQCLKARSNTGLRRWVNGDGTDTWQVEAPTETSRAAYAAVNDLALQLKKTTGADIAAARAAAMFQLILGHSTGSYQVHVGIPLSILASAAATVADADLGESDLVEVTGMDASGPTYVPRAWLADLLDGTLDNTLHPEPEAEAGHEPEPIDDVGSPGEAAVSRGNAVAHESTNASNVARAPEVPARVDGVGCHDETGSYSTGRLEPVARRRRPGWLTDKYHPTKAIRAAVIARDGHCRFPGCSASGRLCDLDHVIPWPTGPTTPTNLILLCRRHHRVKQRRGWGVRLHPDGTVIWTNPLGDRLVTEPFNHLTTLPPYPPGRAGHG